MRIINRFKNYRRKMNCASVIENRKKYAKAAVTKAIKRYFNLFLCLIIMFISLRCSINYV